MKAGNVTETLTISSYATSNSWANDTKYTSAVVGGVTFSATGSSNTGKYYTTDNTWRYYAGESAKLTITAPSGCTLVSITPTFTTKDNGTLSYGGSTKTSGTAVSVSGTSAEFSVGSSSGSKGKVFFTAIAVTYAPAANVKSVTLTGNFSKTEYKVGEEFSSAGIKATIGYDDESTVENVTEGFTFKIGEAALEDGDALTKGTKTVKVFYDDVEAGATKTIYVGELKSIAIATAPTKTEYDQGQTFDATGMVVRATYNTDDGHSWTEDIDDFTYSPTTALSPSDTEITISYDGKETTQLINVNDCSGESKYRGCSYALYCWQYLSSYRRLYALCSI